MAKRRTDSKPTIAQAPASGKNSAFQATTLKQGTDARPSASQLPGNRTSAKLTDFLQPGATPTVSRPSLVGKRTGGVPQNKRGGKRGPPATSSPPRGIASPA